MDNENETFNSTDELDGTNANLTDVDTVHHQTRHSTIFHVFLSAQVIIGAIGWVGSILLLYGQSRTAVWPFYQRLLFFNVTIASMITAAIHCVQGTVQLVKFSLTGDGELGDSEWSDIGGDSAHVAVAFGLMTLALQNLFALYRCGKCPDYQSASETGGRKQKALLGTLLVVVVWSLAIGSIVGGLNPHAEAGDDGDTDMAYISYAVHLAIQIIVITAIIITRRLAQRLETDFAARGAQHTLHTRSHVKETISVTSAITRVLILHIITWMASFTVAFVINHAVIMPAKEEKLSESEEDGVDNEIAAYTGIVDCLALCFEAAYPLALSMKERSIKRGIISLIHCSFHEQLQSPTTGSSPKGVSVVGSHGHGTANVSNGARMHHSAIDQHWNMIIKVKYDKNKQEVDWAAKK